MHPALRTKLCDLLGIEKPIVQAGWVSCSLEARRRGLERRGAGDRRGGAPQRRRVPRGGAQGQGHDRQALRGRHPVRDLREALGRCPGRGVHRRGPATHRDRLRREGAGDRLGPGQPGAHRAAGPRGRHQGHRARGNTKNAKRVAAGGVDAVVAQGYDGGGHTGQVGTFTLVQAVVDAVKQPVVAAGGVADGRGLVAALALGATGVWLAPGSSRAARPTPTQTTRTRSPRRRRRDDPHPVLQRQALPRHQEPDDRRVGEPSGRDPAVPAPGGPHRQDHGQEPVRGARLHGEIDIGACAAGQACAIIHEVKGAGEIVEDIAREASEILERLATRVGRV